jgi:hypothetical protein
MAPRNGRSIYPNGTALIAPGRQALMSSVSPEFVNLETDTVFLVKRCAPRMAPSESSNR